MTSSEILQGVGLDAVIGMYSVVHRLRSTVVTPLVAASLGDPLVRPPKLVLLYGPPRCGGRFIALHLAAEIEALAAVKVARIPYLDSMASDRAMADALDAAEQDADVVVATCHRPWELSDELIERFDRLAFVHPPDWDARRFRLWETPLGRVVDDENLERFISATEGWCGEDLAASFVSIDRAALEVARREAEGSDGAVTTEWLAVARTYAHSRSDGFDDLISYLQRMRRW